MKVSKQELQELASVINDLCGICIDMDKAYLIETRLTSVIHEEGCSDFSELCRMLKSPDAALKQRIINAITTNETLFFREDHQFKAMSEKILPDLIAAKAANNQPKRIRIWSAACSTGQEPYSIAMTLLEALPNCEQWDIEIVASDISSEALSKAEDGVYSQADVKRGLNDTLLSKYFQRNGTSYQINRDLRQMIQFRAVNLLKPFTDLTDFDIVFCRNVAIYFNDQDKEDLYRRLARTLTAEGYLFVASSESITTYVPEYTPQRYRGATFYQPNMNITYYAYDHGMAAGLRAEQQRTPESLPLVGVRYSAEQARNDSLRRFVVWLGEQRAKLKESIESGIESDLRSMALSIRRISMYLNSPPPLHVAACNLEECLSRDQPWELAAQDLIFEISSAIPVFEDILKQADVTTQQPAESTSP